MERWKSGEGLGWDAVHGQRNESEADAVWGTVSDTSYIMSSL